MNNDKILSYINSKDIRQHLKNIQYSFNSAEIAWLIYQCQHLTIEEKHQEWRELISAMPDMAVQSRVWKQPIESIHKFLAKYMSIDTQSNTTDNDTSILAVFDEMWFSFPTPFVKGDILHDITKKSVNCYCGGPVVMDMIAPDYFSENGRTGFDVSDMCVWGYFQDTDTGNIYEENAYNYMNFEYYPKEQLTEKRRVLFALSNYIKGNISLSLFVKAYHQILTEEYAKDLMPKEFTAEGLTLAGLNNE